MSRGARATYRERSMRAKRARARYIARCRMLITGILGAVILCAAFSIGVLRSMASSSDTVTDYKYYKNIVVSYHYDLGDAAEDYADEHYKDDDDYLREVCNINHFASAEDATPGTHVIVPYYSTELR